MQSSIYQHLLPLRNLISKPSINEAFQIFFEEVNHENDIIESDPLNYTIRYLTISPQGTTVELIANFDFFLRRKFSNALEEVRGKIGDYAINKLSEPTAKGNYVDLQKRYLQNIIDSNHQVIQQFPFIVHYLKVVEQEINMIGPEDHKPIPLNLGGLIEVDNRQSPIPQVVIVDKIFSFFQNLNNRQERIMSNAEYDRMRIYIADLIAEGVIPDLEEQEKLTANLDKGTLKFCFWVLHRELYKSHEINPIFFYFLKKVFSSFGNWEIPSIRKTFRTRPKAPRAKLPDIVQKYLDA